ncbi:MAG: SemiSWEET transporter [Flavobacteriales bacterium]|nr:SemiSWEET transporter [Flavobacteriales bacterium]
MEDWINIIGILAGICTTLAVVPQIRKSWKTKDVKDVSPGMFAILLTGISLWCVYGILREDLPLILANGTSLTLNGIMVYLMVRYRNR